MARARELPHRSAPGGRIYNLVGEWRSSEAHLAGGQGVAGSNPASPTKFEFKFAADDPNLTERTNAGGNRVAY
jgi:hypothetical protein